MRIDRFEYIRPTSIQEACVALAEHGAAAKVLAGGTDLVVRMKQGIASPGFVVDIRDISALSYIQPDGGGLRIGAATPLRDIESSSLVRERFPALAQAVEKVASVQLRNMGTLSGNICQETMCWYYNQSRAWKKSKPACNKAGGELCYVVNKPDVCYATYRGDTATALMALGATVRLQSSSGERVLALEDFFTGDGKAPHVAGAGELLTEVVVPARPERSASAYLKISHRAAVDYPQAAVGVVVALAEGKDTFADARIVLGAVGSGPARSRKAEDALRGRPVADEVIAEAAEAAMKDAHPVNNMAHGSPSYRRQMAKVLTRRALAAVVAAIV